MARNGFEWGEIPKSSPAELKLWLAEYYLLMMKADLKEGSEKWSCRQNKHFVEFEWYICEVDAQTGWAWQAKL